MRLTDPARRPGATPWPVFVQGVPICFVRLHRQIETDMPLLLAPPAPIMEDVGRFFFAWSGLDHAMELAIWRMEGLSDDDGKAQTESLTSGPLHARLGKNMARLSDETKADMASTLRAIAPLLEVRRYMAHASINWSPSRQALAFRKTSDHLPNGKIRLRTRRPRHIRQAATAAATIALRLFEMGARLASESSDRRQAR